MKNFVISTLDDWRTLGRFRWFFVIAVPVGIALIGFGVYYFLYPDTQSRLHVPESLVCAGFTNLCLWRLVLVIGRWRDVHQYELARREAAEKLIADMQDHELQKASLPDNADACPRCREYYNLGVNAAIGAMIDKVRIVERTASPNLRVVKNDID